MDAGHGLVTLLSLSVMVKDRPLHKSRGKSQIYYPEHILVYERLEDLLLSCRGSDSFQTDYQGFFGGGGPCTAQSLGLRGGGLESQFGRGPGHPGQESDGLVLLVPWVQAGRVFSGYPAGGSDSRIAGQSGTTCFVSSTVVRTERWKMKKGNLIAYHLLESSTGAYIEWLVNELTHC